MEEKPSFLATASDIKLRTANVSGISPMKTVLSSVFWMQGWVNNPNNAGGSCFNLASSILVIPQRETSFK